MCVARIVLSRGPRISSLKAFQLYLESQLDNHCAYPASSIRRASQHGKYFVGEVIELGLRLLLHVAGEMLQSVLGPF